MEACTMKVALEGATRELYRMKIYTKWRGCDNYVAKKYRDHVGATKDMYFSDCQMQMVAKKVAEEYNKLKPPHRIDFLECFVIEERTSSSESAYWCCEKFVAGDYVKHSGNSGFVQEVHHRLTPHAFSHFSFVHSKGKRMIVDIQGVGDLWTDPQVHSIDKPEDFGVGNLGISGIAKFFKTYRFNPLCEWIGLVPFEHSPTGQEAQMKELDWDALTHQWQITDLATRINPFRASIAKRCASLGADVHFKLAQMYENGQFDEVDLESAVFHVECAAKMGDADANVVLAKVYSGISRDTLREHTVEEDIGRAFAYWLTAAQAGSLEAMSAVASFYDGTFSCPTVDKSYKEAVSWYNALVSKHEELSETADLAEDDFELHRILAKVASLHEQGGHGLKRSAAKAYALYTEAAEAAEEHMKSKLASKYYDKANELEAEAEAEAEEVPCSPSSSLPDPSSPGFFEVNKSDFGAGALESLADTLLSVHEEKGDMGAAATNFCAAYATYKKAVEQERKAELHHDSSTKTWVCMCYHNPSKAGEIHRMMPERSKYLVANGLHVRFAGSLKNSAGEVEAMQYVLHMSREEVDAWLAQEPLQAANCYERTSCLEMQQHWSNIAA
eukprot:Tamp_08030.p1 GENE.Tamp_08030~~Tamp_08030.p1  ORF type:complete len:614 (+),score=141.95 Tamp_08030:318-2159(+)